MNEKKDALYLECYSGISGDMVTAALLDLGADEVVLRKALASLPLDGFSINISRVKKAGLDACDFDVVLDAEHENHDHDMAYLYGGVEECGLHLHVGQEAPRVRNGEGRQGRHRPTVTRRGALRARSGCATADAKPGPNRAPRLFFAPRPKSGGANVPPPRPSSYHNKTCRPHARHPAPIQTDAEAGKAAKAEIYLNRSSAITTLWSLTVSEGM